MPHLREKINALGVLSKRKIFQVCNRPAILFNKIVTGETSGGG